MLLLFMEESILVSSKSNIIELSTVKIYHFVFNSLDWQYSIDYGNNHVDSIGNSIGIE